MDELAVMNAVEAREAWDKVKIRIQRNPKIIVISAPTSSTKEVKKDGNNKDSG